MRRTKRNVLGIVMSLLFVLNFAGCKSAEEKVMAENRDFVQTKYSEATYIDKSKQNYDKNKAEELKKSARKEKFVRWTAHITKIESDSHRVFLKEENLPLIQAGCNYSINASHEYKEGDLVTISGNIYDYDTGDSEKCKWKLEYGRIEETTDEDKKALDDYLAGLENAKKEAETKEKEAKAKEEEDKKTAEETQKKEEADKQQAKEDAKKIISTDYISFEEPYSKMTEIQKDDYFKTVKGRYVQWTGTVVDVDKHTIGVRCLDNTLTDDFVAIVDNLDPEKLKNIQKGSKITIKGRISQQEGNALPWTLNTCTIV